MPKQLNGCEETTPKKTFNIIPTDFVLYSRRGNLIEKDNKKLDDIDGKYRFRLEHFRFLNGEQTDRTKSVPELFYDLERRRDDDEVSDHQVSEAISDTYYPNVKKGKINVKRSILKRFEPDGVVLDDGSFVECDVVVFCIGYELVLNQFLSAQILDTLKFDRTNYKFPYLLYKCTFHPDLSNMAMIGQNDGIYFLGAELQARWATSVFAGKRQLPDAKLMTESILELEARRKMNLGEQFSYGTYNEILDELGQQLDALPDFDTLKRTDPRVYDLMANYPILSCHYFYHDETRRGVLAEKLSEIEEIVRKEYEFDADLSDDEITTEMLAARFAAENPKYNVPIHIFKC